MLLHATNTLYLRYYVCDIYNYYTYSIFALHHLLNALHYSLAEAAESHGHVLLIILAIETE